MSATATLCLTRASDEILRLNGVLADLFARAETDPTVADDLKLCLNEAIANVMAYGETRGEALSIDVRIAAGRAGAEAVIDDNCHLFDPLAHPAAQPITGLADAQVGGFGIALIRQTARDVRWTALGDYGNRLTLVCGATAA